MISAGFLWTFAGLLAAAAGLWLLLWALGTALAWRWPDDEEDTQ